MPESIYGWKTEQIAKEFAELNAKDRARRLVSMIAALVDIAAGSCCETEGCSEEDPMCDTMIARAGLKGLY